MKKMILAVACLGLGLAACGGDDEVMYDPAAVEEPAPDLIIAEPVEPTPYECIKDDAEVCIEDPVLQPDPVPEEPVKPGKGGGKPVKAEAAKADNGKGKPES